MTSSFRESFCVLLFSFFGLAAVVQATVQDTNRPRSRAEIQEGRRALRERTKREIDALVAEFHGRLPRGKASSIGAVYARYSTRFQDSIVDQIRSLLEDAVKRGIFVPREFVFFDLAVRGAKKQRLGLDALRDVLSQRRVSVLLLFATNRLFRKVFRTLEFVDQAVKEWGIRCIFVQTGVDSDDKKRWEMLLHMHSMMDEFAASMYADNIRAAHEGLFQKQMVFGTITYGFTGDPIPDQVTRRGLPSRRLAIDELTSQVVVQIFRWYVEDRISMDEIARRLNDSPHIPLPYLCRSGAWSHQLVRRILANSRYRGFWEYGVYETVFMSSKDYAKKVARDEPLQAMQFEELRIMPDGLWYGAQKRLSEEVWNGGRKPKDNDKESRPKLFNGFFRCPEHDRPLYVCGAYGHQMFCPACKGVVQKKRLLYSMLNRQLATQLTCEALVELIQQDDQLVKLVIKACQEQAHTAQKPDESRLDDLRQQDARLARTIEFNMRHAGDDDVDEQERHSLLQNLRHERQSVRAELGLLESQDSQQIEIPTEEDVRNLLTDFSHILVEAANGEQSENLGRAREIVKLMTGGRIELFQQGERKAKRGWLRGRFQVRLVEVVVEKLVGVHLDCNEGIHEVVIDYHRPLLIEEQAEQAKEMFDAGLLKMDIAKRMKRSRGYITKLLTHWYDSRSLNVPDGRKRRSTLMRKQTRETMYEQRTDAAKGHWDAGMSILAIGRELACSEQTVRNALEHWHRLRGLTVQTERSRRQGVVERVKDFYDASLTYNEIADRLGYSTVTVRKMLREWARDHDEKLPDGRNRRHKLEK